MHFIFEIFDQACLNRVTKILSINFYVQYSPDLLSCGLYYTDALDSNELSVSNILCLCPIDGPCLFQLKEFFYSFLFHIKIKILDLRHMDVLSRKLGIEL